MWQLLLQGESCLCQVVQTVILLYMAAQWDTHVPSTVSSQNEKPNNIQAVNFHGNGEYKVGVEQHPKLVSDDSFLSVKERDAVNVS